jgi:hypothetical protein
MPRGASPKRERAHEEMKGHFEKEGRYPGREEEVAARIVNKRRSQYGETKRAREEARRGESPDRGLPIKGYQHMTVAQIKRRLGRLSRSQVQKIRQYEVRHKNRKSLLEAIDRRS